MNSASPDGGTADVANPDDNRDNKPVYTVWHGYDVVLTKNRDGGHTRSESNTTENYPQAAAHAKPTSHHGAKSSSSWRRMSSGDDYGWLRQLDLRSDVPDMDEIRNWSFDVLVFEDTVLIEVFIKMLEYYNFLEKFQLDRKTLERYCGEVMARHHKDGYYQKYDIEKNSVTEECKPEVLCEYHSWYHAVACAHVSFLFLSLGGADGHLDPIEQFCIIMGALIHDLDHPGTNNDFEVKRNTSLAKLYDNDAVLERHSINVGLNMCLENPDLDWWKSFQDEKDREYMKKYISESILATDPAKHASIVKEALSFVEKGPPYFNKNDPQHRIFIGRLILHSADITNPLHSSFEVASDWAIRVVTEFDKQAKREKELQLPVTSFMDGLDNQVSIAKTQIGFYQFMLKPLFNTVGIFFPALKMLEDWGEMNCVEYQKVIDDHDKECAKKLPYGSKTEGETPF